MARMEPDSKRRIVSGSLLGIGVILGVTLFVIVNYLGWKYHSRFDWTRTRLYSLSEKTENVLAELERRVEIVVFLSPVDPLYGPVRELLQSYDSASERLKIRYIDPEKNLIEARSLVDQFQLTQLDVIVFDSGDDRRVVSTSDLADYDYSGLQFGQGAQMTGFTGEQVFTSTLLELVESRKPRILFTSGHGELQLDDFSPRGLSAARDLLGKDNFELEDWASLGQGAVPEGTDLLVVAGPTSTFVEPELEAFRDYLESGGRLLVLLDPTLRPSGGLVATGLESLLMDYGVEVGANIVVDPASPLPFFSAETIFVNTYGDHLITRALDQAQLPVIIPLARSMKAIEEVEGLTAVELMMTTIEGWGESNLENLQQVEKGDEDLEGPVPLAVAVSATAVIEERTEPGLQTAEPAATEGDAQATGEPDSGEAQADSDTEARQRLRLVAIGDSDFATNGQLQNVPNATLLANALNWLVERELLVGIPPKQPEQVRLSLTASELSLVSWLVLAGLPGLAIVLGVAVFLRRRR